MTESPLDRIASKLGQALFDADRRAQGQQPYPLSATTLNRDEYAAMAARVMAAIGPLLAEEAAYLWPAARPCPPLPFTGKTCANTAPLPHHCYGATDYVPDAHDKSEARNA